MPWSDQTGQTLQQAPIEGIYSYLLLLMCLIGLNIFGTGPLTTQDTIEFYQFRFLTKLGSMYPYASTYNSLASMGSSVYLSWDQLQPWPNAFQGRLGWYRQGLHEVQGHRATIEALDSVDAPEILLAAAIANQGNSPQRLFGSDLFERGQRWLGEHIDWPLPQWQWAQAQWDRDFKQCSIGIGQIMPEEIRLFGFDETQTDLLDPGTNLKLMRAKLAATSQAAASLGLNKTDWFILVAIGNNEGPGLVQYYQKAGRDMQRFLAND